MSIKFALECFVIFVFIVQIVISYFFGEIAKMKGYQPTKYIILCLLFGLAGWILVLALPDLTLKGEKKSITDPYEVIDDNGNIVKPETNKKEKTENILVGIFVGLLILCAVFLILYFA